MDEYEVQGNVKGLRNYVVPIPGSTVICYLGQWDDGPYEWTYSLWEGGYNETLIAVDSINTPEKITAYQAARIAFLLEIDYGPHNETCSGWIDHDH